MHLRLVKQSRQLYKKKKTKFKTMQKEYQAKTISYFKKGRFQPGI